MRGIDPHRYRARPSYDGAKLLRVSDLPVGNRIAWRRAHFWMMRFLYLTRVTLSTTF